MINTTLRNKRITDTAALLGSGTLTIYSGTPPTSANDPLSGNVALASHTLVGFGAASNGAVTANPIANDTIDNNGTATFARIVAGTYVIQLAVGISNAPVIVNNLSFSAGGNSIVNSVILREPE